MHRIYGPNSFRLQDSFHSFDVILRPNLHGRVEFCTILKFQLVLLDLGGVNYNYKYKNVKMSLFLLITLTTFSKTLSVKLLCFLEVIIFF